MENNIFTSVFGYKLIYIFRINDENHKDILKIGDATIHSDKSVNELDDNCEDLNMAAKARIDQYTKTAGIVYELLYTTLAVNNAGKAFRDLKVHKVLKNSGITTKFLNSSDRNEWFKTNLETAKNAIKACKEGRSYINSNEKSNKEDPIILRPEQKEAVEKTIKNFKTSDRMLWNAKMRFGKTICALEIVKRQEYKKTIILTHRPVVDDGWFADFNKIFADNDNYKYGSKNKGERIDKLLKDDNNFVYFASIQDLRGSTEVGGTFEKNELVFNTEWDFAVIDEAHEGTKTNRGERTIEGVVKIHDNYPTKLLELSGTPFNLLADYEEKQIYTWDYVMEQSAKLNWKTNHEGDYNPYEDLPQMNIFTYDLSKNFKGYVDLGDKSFNFREFFRTWTGNTEIDRKEMPEGVKKGEFVHEKDVRRFLDLMTLDNEKTNYPFSKDKYRDYFRHSLWMIPGVKEAKALSKLLKEHEVFGSGAFKIVNVAGDGDEEDTQKSKEKVDNAITNRPEDTYTITLSCGRLTTGVSIPAWTAVFMLNGGNSTSASSYLQTIFRVQTPANIGGKMKDKCYVFDFAPDRTLKMMAEAGQLSAKPGSIESKSKMGDLLNFCPVIAVDGSRMIPYNVDAMLRTLKKAYADRVVRNGFDDTKIYNDKLLKLDGIELEAFNELQTIIGASKQTKKINEIDINNQGFTDEEYEKLEKINKKPINELTEEEKALRETKKKAVEQKNKAISILRGISIRIPLLVYGADIPDIEEVTVDNFTDIIDDVSWKEFMPKGVTKEKFKQFSKYYDQEIFVEAGNRIRNITKYADTLTPLERTKEIANLFATFKNPDKETVLTPWRTVNMHMGDTIGGYNFYDDKFIVTIEEPRLIINDEVTNDVLFNSRSKVLEINSKSGLYPLYITYSIFRQRCLDTDSKKLTEEVEKALWKATLEENVFVVARTEMAKSITQRTLTGYNDFKTNILCYENLIDDLKINLEKVKSKLNNSLTWQKKDGEKMKFNVVVGNPPYQENIAGREEQPPLYHLFYDCSMSLSNRVTLITPARFLFDAGKTPSNWNKKMLNDIHFKVIDYFSNSKMVFENVDIKGGVAITCWDKMQDFGAIETFAQDNNVRKILDKVKKENINSLSSILYSNTSYKYTNLFFEENKDFSDRVSGGSSRYLSSSAFYKFPEVFFKTDPLDGKKYIKIIGRKNNERVTYFLDSRYINPPENFEKYKVFLASSNGTGTLGETLSEPILGNPFVGSTETFISFGSFEKENDAKNFIKYIRTKFARLMLGTKKVTQGNKNSKVWSNVPLQDFTDNSDIDWSKSISEIDKQLYKKYNLTEEEINYIENKISAM